MPTAAESQTGDTAQRLNAIRQRIRAVARAGPDPNRNIRLVAVSKTRSADELRAALAAGQRDFGENYVQEALEKIEQLTGKPICWHFIGPLQSNKTREVAEHFHWCHSLDRLKIARRLNDQRPKALPPLQVCLQVNVSGEASKSGVAPDQVADMAGQIACFPRLSLRGLMAIPESASQAGPQAAQAPFATLRRLLEQLRRDLPGAGPLDTLSMGMSDDFETAIEQGANLVRIGTAVFGPRKQHD